MGETVNDLTVCDAQGTVDVVSVRVYKNTLIINTDTQLTSVSVSFAQSPYCEANLYSDSGLCAAPFKLEISSVKN